MALYSLSTKPMSRKAGRSAVAAAAYRSGAELTDERTGVVHDYTRRRGVEHTEIVTRDGVPAPEREVLWNAAEAAERRKDSRVAREYVVALPHELDADQRLALARELAGELVERYGIAVDLAVHAPDAGGDERNHHAHLLATTRAYGHDGLGDKVAIEWSDKKRKAAGLERGADEVRLIRQRWESMANSALNRANIAARIDCRSLAEQGIDRVPQIHRGPMATEQIRQGTPEQSERALLSLEIDATNAQRQQLRERLDAERAIEEWAEITPATPFSPASEMPEAESSPVADAELAMARESAWQDAQERIEERIAGRHQLQIRGELRELEAAQQRRWERIEEQEWEEWISRPEVCSATGRVYTEMHVDSVIECERALPENQPPPGGMTLEQIAQIHEMQEIKAAQIRPASQTRPQPAPEPKPAPAQAEALRPQRRQEPPKASHAVQRIDRQIDAKRRELLDAKQQSGEIGGRVLEVQMETRRAAERSDSARQSAEEATQAVKATQAEVDSLGGLFKRGKRREAQGRLDAAQERQRSAQESAQAAKAHHAALSREYGQLREQAAPAKQEVERLESEYQGLQQQRTAQIEREQRPESVQEQTAAPEAEAAPTANETADAVDRARATAQQMLIMPTEGERSSVIREAAADPDPEFFDELTEQMIQLGIGHLGELTPAGEQRRAALMQESPPELKQKPRQEPDWPTPGGDGPGF